MARSSWLIAQSGIPMGFISGVPAIDPSLTHGPEMSFVVTGDSSIPARHPYQGAIADEITFFDGFCQGGPSVGCQKVSSGSFRREVNQ
jgi:hypothetical protein